MRLRSPAPFSPQSSQRSGRFHTPAVPGAAPGTATIAVQEPKPQKTGTGLLIRPGEAATASGSTSSLPGRLIVGQRPLKARMLVRFQPRQPRRTRKAESGIRNGRPCSTGTPPCKRRRSALRIPSSTLGTPGGETGSRLSYKQKSEVRLLPGRPAFRRSGYGPTTPCLVV